MDINETFETSLSKLGYFYPYYGYLLSRIHRRERPGIQTMQVELSLTTGEITLAYNYDFMMSLSYAERLYVMQHEVLHLSEGHLLYNVTDKTIFNIAADLVVNQILNKVFVKEQGKPNSVSMPKGAITIEDKLFFHLKRDESTMYYYEALIEECKGNPCKRQQMMDMLGVGEFKIVVGSGDGNEMQVPVESISGQNMERLEGVLSSKLAEAASQLAGNMPSEISRGIVSNKKVSQINWKTALNNFLRNTKSSKRRVNRNRHARNNIHSFATISNKEHRVLCGLDVSGSVSDSDIELFVSEMEDMYRTRNCKITLIQCDTKIASVKEYKGEKTITRSATGGTELDPIVDYYNKNKASFDGVIIITDGYFSLTPKLIQFKPCLWLFFEKKQMLEEIAEKKKYFIHNK